MWLDAIDGTIFLCFQGLFYALIASVALAFLINIIEFFIPSGGGSPEDWHYDDDDLDFLEYTEEENV